MNISLDQTAYWDRVAEEKTFNHQLDWNLLENYLEPTSEILDFGCGYGRLTNDIHTKGFHKVRGVGSSKKMIDQAKKKYPQLDFNYLSTSNLAFESNSFDLVCLFAVLTCIPRSHDQQKIIRELKRVLKPNGILYISDLLINDNKRNKLRYNASTATPYGVFELSEGVTLRHHTLEYLETDLMASFKTIYKKPFNVTTMNGNNSSAIQLIGKKKT